MKILVGIVLFLLVITVATVLVAGIGYGLTLILPLTVFEASMLLIATTFVLAFIIAAVAHGYRISTTRDFFATEEEEEEEEENEDDDWNRPVIQSIAVGRNQPCPCGSGKKFKYCCGRR